MMAVGRCRAIYPGSNRPGDRIVQCSLLAGHLDGDNQRDHEEADTGNTWPEPAKPPVVGTPEHAERITEGRHPGVRDALQWLTFSHLPEELGRYSEPFYLAGGALVRTIASDSPELTTALNKLVEAKDSAVRAGIKDSTGRAGSVPRPDTVVDRPAFGPDTVGGSNRG